MRFAVYTRFSSDKQKDTSTLDQLRNCQLYADQNGWLGLSEHVYSDKGLSGTTRKGRAALERLLLAAAAKPRPFDCVLVDDTSRLARNKLDQAQIIADLEDEGVFIYFVSDGIDTRDEIAQDVVLPVMGIKNAIYGRDLAKKTKRGMVGQVLRGYNAGGRAYGYAYTPQPDQSGTRISINPDQATVVKTIFSMYASGHGLRGIAIALNDQEITPPRPNGRGWCPHGIRAMLRNPKYHGDFTWNRYQWTRKRKTGKRVRVARPQSEWIEFLNDELRIVDEELWDAVQTRNQENAKRYATGERAPRKSYLVSGLLRCGICNASLIVTDSAQQHRMKYACSTNWHRGATACPNNVRILKSDIEDRILKSLKDRILNPDVITFIVEKVNLELKKRGKGGQERRNQLEKELETVAEELQNLARFVATGDTSSTIRQAIKDKESGIQTIRFQLQQLRSTAAKQDLTVKAGLIVQWFKRLEELIESNPAIARLEVGKIIGNLTAVPASQQGKTGLLLTGKPRLDGILGVVTGFSTSSNSGDRI